MIGRLYQLGREVHTSERVSIRACGGRPGGGSTALFDAPETESRREACCQALARGCVVIQLEATRN